MNLGEKLDELRNNLLRDRSDLVAGDSDSFWSDDSLLRYIKDGERRFARQTLLIHDSTTPEICQIQLRTGVQTYPLHPTVLSVLSARFDTNTWDLQRSGHGPLLNITPPELLTFDPTANFNVTPGPPIAYYTDETLVYNRQGGVTYSTYPLPDAASNGKIIYMRVIRLPNCDYTIDALNDETEIPEDYELDPLHWAAYRALSGFDADAGAATTADKHKTAFDLAVKNAITETKRKIFTNVNYRFGMAGFSWER